MSLVQAAVLGLVQGLTEFLPVSSSGHLILTPILFGWQDQGLVFDTVLHLGTLAALLLFFRADLVMLVRSAFRQDAEGKATRVFFLKILIAIVPVLVLAALLNDVIEAHARNASLVAFDLAFWGLILLLADQHAMKRNADAQPGHYTDLTWKQALIVGLAQPLSLLPGTSRSGITITAGLFAGLSRATAARFSFLISIPITALAGLHGIVKVVQEKPALDGLLELILGFVVAAVSGSIAIPFLLRYVSKYRYHVFAYYRFALALLVAWIV